MTKYTNYSKQEKVVVNENTIKTKLLYNMTFLLKLMQISIDFDIG